MPALMRALDPCSPSMQVLQFISHRLEGDSCHLTRLVCGPVGVQSISQLAQHLPHLLSEYRQECVLGAAWMCIRFENRFAQWQFPVARVADSRLPDADRLLVAQRFLSDYEP